MAKHRRQKRSRSIGSSAVDPIVNIADRRSKRAALQVGRKDAIFVAVPSLDGFIHSSIGAQFARALSSNAIEECPFRFAIHVENGKRGPEYARNCIVRAFMRDSDADWLLMVDHDQIMPDNFWQLCAVRDADVVSGVTPCWVGNMDPEAMFRVNNYGINDKGQCYNLPVPPDEAMSPYRVPVVGTGCIAIRRRVFAPKPYGLGQIPFRFTRADDGKVNAGEDVNFSVDANRAGFVVCVHPQVRFDHVKQLPMWQAWAWHRALSKLESEGRTVTDEQRISVG